MVDLSKFTLFKKILSKVVTLGTTNFITKLCPFENLTIESHVFYTLNTYIKFCANNLLFTI